MSPDLLTKAVDLLGGSTAKLALAEALTELGTLQARHGRSEKAVATLLQAMRSSDHCGARPSRGGPPRSCGPPARA
ncbi:hypothetical protein AVL48_11210 [Amycolatopsis regifaucium]|uniref:Tetratrico peptide repeat group 5 domain-containing protein n=1 Tax=Amycolatopsis regifaucium TaxID=546365 RepID=A0A154MD34_9PSEU|nr:hypothetical protein AVL48_11210 [Amycolatopsis regifaucium]SFJ43322.1 hypothetical protein SAMN04489731_12144 [Amycolatopsis regifaucium]